MASVAVLICKPSDAVDAARAAAEVAGAGGRPVIVVSASRPYKVLRPALEGANEDLHILDVVSSSTGNLPADKPPGVTFVASPTMLEMIAMRVEQLRRVVGEDAHVVLDSLSSLVLYNGARPVEEFAHFLCNRLRLLNMSATILVHDDEAGRRLADRIGGFVDEVTDMEAA